MNRKTINNFLLLLPQLIHYLPIPKHDISIGRYTLTFLLSFNKLTTSKLTLLTKIIVNTQSSLNGILGVGGVAVLSRIYNISW
jgi:hypothetical protein